MSGDYERDRFHAAPVRGMGEKFSIVIEYEGTSLRR